jgi:pimeloyl-ACP methyl ester carboxylesterase
MLLFAGGNDVLVAPNDYSKLLNLLPGNVKSKVIEDYNHLDYMWAADVNEYVNDDVRAFLKNLQ